MMLKCLTGREQKPSFRKLTIQLGHLVSCKYVEAQPSFSHGSLFYIIL